jgi:hypothetical protein
MHTSWLWPPRTTICGHSALQSACLVCCRSLIARGKSQPHLPPRHSKRFTGITVPKTQVSSGRQEGNSSLQTSSLKCSPRLGSLRRDLVLAARSGADQMSGTPGFVPFARAMPNCTDRDRRASCRWRCTSGTRYAGLRGGRAAVAARDHTRLTPFQRHRSCPPTALGDILGRSHASLCHHEGHFVASNVRNEELP